MKKVVFIILFLTVSALGVFNFAQVKKVAIFESNYDQTQINQCVRNLFTEVYSCLNALGVTSKITETSNQLYIRVEYESLDPGIRGRIQSCVADYNSNRHECPDAPVMIIRNE
ncbi:MAG: hypothetical protein HY738_03960 [Bacteroidia bacterium]|nr:hypothetical protein [Bacteroidia bacterium]